jgi:hypothetical protein
MFNDNPAGTDVCALIGTSALFGGAVAASSYTGSIAVLACKGFCVYMLCTLIWATLPETAFLSDPE